MAKLNIVAISDLHGYLPEITVPAEIMLIAGDISPLMIQRNIPKVKEWLETKFLEWVIRLPVQKVFLIAGNHDWFQSWRDSDIYQFEKMFGGKLKYLVNETTEYLDTNGIYWSIFGTPYCHMFGSWPFMVSDEYMEELFEKIPNFVDIIISHDPPFSVGYVDVILEKVRHMGQEEHVGNYPLRKRLEKIKYLIGVFGHIHSGSHQLFEFNGGQCVNVSIKDERYEPTYEPFYYALEK